ncbi:MAG: flagellar basal body rod protein FlgB [Bacillota bacterium]|nr:flagellar basal body rod protein FlgB [Bacillota bacterium]
MNEIFGGNSMTVLQKSLDALWLRQKVVSNNIANVDTPGYKSQTVQFESLLNDALQGSTGQTEDQLNAKLQNLNPQVQQDTSTTMRADGNNVDIDSENVSLARTQIEYLYATRMMSSEISRMKYAITEGKG